MLYKTQFLPYNSSVFPPLFTMFIHFSAYATICWEGSPLEFFHTFHIFFYCPTQCGVECITEIYHAPFHQAWPEILMVSTTQWNVFIFDYHVPRTRWKYTEKFCRFFWHERNCNWFKIVTKNLKIQHYVIWARLWFTWLCNLLFRSTKFDFISICKDT